MISRSLNTLDALRIEASQNGYDYKTTEFLLTLINDFPQYNWRFGRKFSYRPLKTITLGPAEAHSQILALHELGHAISQHLNFKIDIERLKMEVEAWEKARKLADKYTIPVDEDLIQDELDSYRDWLHQKSRCPKCGLTRFQTPDSVYHCPLCEKL